jgi:hypothetical protein
MNENYLTDYGIFNGIIEGIPITICTNQIKKENWNDYYNNLLNVFRDYIEIPQVQSTFIKFIFDDGLDVDLVIEDALY